MRNDSFGEASSTGDSARECGRTTRDIHMYARVKIKKKNLSISITSLSSTAYEETFSSESLLLWFCSKKKISEFDIAAKLYSFTDKFYATRRIVNLENSVCNVVAVLYSSIYGADRCGLRMTRIT